MAPLKRYRSPHEQLIDSLAAARLDGLRFDEAWTRAMRPGPSIVMTTTKAPPAGAILWPTDSSERLAWMSVLASVRDEVRRAYERRPATRREAAVVALVQTIDQIRGGDGIARRATVRSAA